MKVFLALSHKGGTGRSVTTANVAQRIAAQGKHVCVVDLDLASPTFASIFELDDIAAGVPPDDGKEPKSIADFLENPGDCQQGLVRGALHDLWQSPKLQKVNHGGAFRLLPGRQEFGDLSKCGDKVAPVLATLLSKLEELDHDVVFCDLRSGLSEVVHAFAQRDMDALITGWIFHFRWTEQHMAGFENMISSPILKNRVTPENLFVVRTAFPNVDDLPNHMREWAKNYSGALNERWRRITLFDELVSDHEIGTIPFDPMLLWKETVILKEDVDNGRAAEKTHLAFNGLAKNLLDIIVR